MTNKPTGRIVYSTALGRCCPECGKTKSACCCKTQKQPIAKGDGIARIRRETKGRNGKAVTVVSGTPVSPTELQELGKRLKQKCGTGGTIKDGQIEIQGDHRDLILKELVALGYKAKMAGG